MQIKPITKVGERAGEDRRRDVPVVIWIDAICINQKDVAERSAQVRIMAEIYQQAFQVVIWLGEHDPQSRRAFEWVRYAESRLPPAIRGMTLDQIMSGIELVKTAIRWWFEVIIFEGKVLVGIRETFDIFTQRRNWWTRKWIVQEFSLARHARLQCGNTQLDWDATMNVWNAISAVPPYFTQHSKGIGSGDTYMRPLDDCRRRIRKSKLSLGEVIDLCWHQKATDRRDNVYALLSLCFVSDRLDPDYMKTVVQVYEDATKELIANDQDLNSLCQRRRCIHSEAQKIATFPSWTVDIGREYYSGFGPQWYKTYETFSACDGAVHDPALLLSSKANELLVRAVQCDEVSSITTFFELTSSSSWENPDAMMRRAHAWWNDNRAFFDAEPKIAVKDIIETVRMEEDTTSGNLWSDRYETTWVDLTDLTSDLFAEPEICGYCDKMHGKQHSDDAELLILSLDNHFGCGWMLCRMSSGRLSWIPNTAEVGDRVFVVNGCNMPLVLKTLPTEPHHHPAYSLVGHCYVHGIMHGEWVRDGVAERAELIRLL
ncbi:hypothetical protein H2198_002865 [Neophaeococcomyces mojaviensis]|uniref:Uncharacterized protein n=1 Tax=Neophaeococcomyces mojaviensis TaxID=3383035 RepID=A0ACC3AD44_9EURO|nr:hypothetical protein H2198_002865 [Knufia sp. JES_112]